MGNNLFFGGIIMKELFSSAISVFTSLALISSSAISYASAAGSVPVDSDLSRETLYLDEARDPDHTADRHNKRNSAAVPFDLALSAALIERFQQ